MSYFFEEYVLISRFLGVPERREALPREMSEDDAVAVWREAVRSAPGGSMVLLERVMTVGIARGRRGGP